MVKGKKILLGELLISNQIINRDQLQEALKVQKETGERLGQTLINLGFVTEKALLDVLEYQLGIPQISLAQYHPESDVLKRVPEQLIRRHKVIPLKIQGNRLSLAMADPLDLIAIDDISLATGMQVAPVLALSGEVEAVINRYYGMSDDVEKSFQDFKGVDRQELDFVLNLEHTDAVGEMGPIVKAVNSIIKQAVQEGASDIHIEPHDVQVRVRFRLDGVLRDVMTLPKQALAPLVSRVKILAGMNISEKRIPQDGRIQIKDSKLNIDLRVSSLPVIYGEKIVIRILDKSKVLLRLSDLGFQPAILERFRGLSSQPYGMIMLTGPTGSGKTTTLYAVLAEVNTEDKNIITIEDPVEYVLSNINQVQVNPKTGLTFATGLRSIVRQDPDIIMVGEIRDSETAEIAVQAASTGHLVLNTMHTNDAAGAITRLIDMGIEPFQVASSVIGVVAQRLVRRICQYCKETYEVPNGSMDRLFLGRNSWENIVLHRGKGCSYCNHTGYKGRIAINELMVISPQIRELILSKAPTGIIMQRAIEDGMIPLREDGIQKVLAGLTTVSEVKRASFTLE